MSCAVLPPLATLALSSPTMQSFKGDQESHLERLIASSQIKSVEPVEGRALVPFFDSSESSNTEFESLQGRPGAPGKHHGLKRNAGERSGPNLAASAAATKKENQQAQSAKHARRAGAQHAAAPAEAAPPQQPAGKARKPRGSAAAGAKSVRFAEASPAQQAPPPTEAPRKGLAKKHARQDSGRNLLALLTGGQQPAGSGGSGRAASPPRKRPEPAPPAGAAAQRFAGPAFSNSPVPESLPIPTAGLLMREAVDGLRSRLML